MLAQRDQLDVTVVRPAVIESALRDPFPGWNQGVNTSAPLTYLAGRGYRFYPAKAELVLDVIPVDLAAHAMIPILGALLSRKQKPIYQLCTSDRESAADAPAGRADRAQQSPRASQGRRHDALARTASGSGRRLAEYLRPRQRDAAASSQAGGGVRAQRASAKKISARRKSKAASTSSRRTPTSRASWSKSIAPISRSWFTLFTRATFARFTRRSSRLTPSIIRFVPT